MICLICMVTDQAMPGIYERAGGNGMRECGLLDTLERVRVWTRDSLAELSPLMV
jgi:hypothetical protein